ncbi:MAG TPA: Mur ligase family protein, partial [Steroidobacteraceae bacterium]
EMGTFLISGDRKSGMSPFPGSRKRGQSPIVARVHAAGASLALAAPADQLFVATELNEWALAATLLERDPARWAGLEAAMVREAMDATPPPALPPVLEETAALTRLGHLAAMEARPDLRALIDAAETRELPWLLDDEVLTLGAGAGHCDFVLDALPLAGDVRWPALHDVPTAVVTGSNGKTTTVRLLAACARAHGWRTGYNCTDGLFLDGTLLTAGDYSGPLGARSVLRDRRAQAAVLETARGGILRRGLAINRARVAVVTNVSSDHFGEYGIHDLEALAEVKLVVANVVGSDGLLVLNADDALLRAKGPQLDRPLGWFALDDAHETLRAHRARGGATCGVRGGRLVAAKFGSGPNHPGRQEIGSEPNYSGSEVDLGAIDAMPLTVDGSAVYNIANLAAAALAALALGIDATTIAAVFARFGAEQSDNPGRLMRFEVGSVRMLIDYAHNPDGLRGVLAVANHLRGAGRLALVLGQAGNRQAADIEQLALTAAEARPDFVVIKETEAYMRGRPPGEVPAILRTALLRGGLSEAALPVRLSELDAVCAALAWAQAGDVLVLPVHARGARAEVVALLKRMHRTGWKAGQALPG